MAYAAFDNKDPRETVVLTFDASAGLATGEILEGTPEVEVKVIGGSDPTFASIVGTVIINQEPVNVGDIAILAKQSVQVVVSGGESDTKYLFAVTCPTSNPDKILTVKGVLPVSEY